MIEKFTKTQITDACAVLELDVDGTKTKADIVAALNEDERKMVVELVKDAANDPIPSKQPEPRTRASDDQTLAIVHPLSGSDGFDKTYRVSPLGAINQVHAAATVKGCSDESEARRVYVSTQGLNQTKVSFSVVPV